MERLLTLTRRLTTRRDMAALLEDLLHGSTTLIPGADFVCVFLYRPECNALVPVGGTGFDLSALQEVQLKPGESITGKTFVARKPLLLPNPEAIRAAQSNLAPEHDQAVRQAIRRPDNPLRSSLAVPLATDDRLLGVLVIDNYDTDRDFTPVDLAVASSLADHAAVAVLNAEEYQEIRALSQQLQHTMTIQQRLLASMMSPQGNFEHLMHAVWTAIRRPYRLLDAQGDVKAMRGIIQDPVSLAISAGQDLLGELQIAGPLQGVERLTVEQALPLIALEFLKDTARQQERLRVQSEAFRRLWERDYAAVDALLTQYGMHAVRLAIGLIQDTTVDAVRGVIEHTNIPLMQREQDLLLMMPESTWQILQQSLPRETRMIIGSPADSLQDLPQELSGVLMLSASSRQLGYPPVTHATCLCDYPDISFMAGIPDAFRQRFHETVVAPFQEDPELLTTLKTWIFSERSPERTAAILHTHPNTIRYRLDKARRRWNRPLDDQAAILLRWAFLAGIRVHL
ncbi:hypothetical protein TPY_2074 [Sulfobacillus acidophilus TPY]|nr:hypothetical protein TPY_2074 [Sulfobacillus acidophilus TPY]